jgi:hypothetical protein
MDNNLQSNNDEISLKDLLQRCAEWWQYLLLKWKIIVLSGLIGATLGVLYSVSKKPVYKATLSFAVEDEKSSSGLGSALGLASSLGLDLGSGGGSIFTGSNLTELIKSRSMVERTLLSPVSIDGKTISLAEMYIKHNRWRKGWDKKPELNSIKYLPNDDRKLYTRDQDSILGKIYNKISQGGLSVAQKDKKLSIINIDVFSTNELFAKYFCESLAREVSDFYIDTKSKKARMNMAILQRQTDSIRRELNGAITGVAIAEDNTFNLNPAINVRRAPSAKRQVDVQANTAILTELVKQTELAKVTLRKETPLIQIIDRPILPLEKTGFGKLKGIILGGFLGVILMLFWLVLNKVFKDL